MPVPPLVTLYEANACSWQETGSTLRSNSKLVSCIKVRRCKCPRTAG